MLSPSVTRFHTMDQVLHKMMKESDNLYAESMYYQIAASTGNRPASAKSARSVERQFINQKLGLDASRYKLADGSGTFALQLSECRTGGEDASLCLPQRQHQAASDSFAAYSGRGWHPEEAYEERQCPRQCEG